MVFIKPIHFLIEKMGTYITQSRNLLVVDLSKLIICILLSIYMHLE